MSIRNENAKRKRNNRDRAATIVSDLLGDDIDGAESMMDDLPDDFDL